MINGSTIESFGCVAQWMRKRYGSEVSCIRLATGVCAMYLQTESNVLALNPTMVNCFKSLKDEYFFKFKTQIIVLGTNCVNIYC